MLDFAATQVLRLSSGAGRLTEGISMKQILLSLVVALFLNLTATAQKVPTVDDRGSLRGLPGFNVLIESKHDAAAEMRGLTESQLQTDVELRLRKAGIRVLTLSEVKAVDAHPTLYVNLHLVSQDPPFDGAYVFHLSVDVRQTVLLVTPPSSKNFACTWETATTGTVGLQRVGDLRGRVGDLVDQLINDYLAANPPKSKNQLSPNFEKLDWLVIA
jgi:hypothetical protein